MPSVFLKCPCTMCPAAASAEWVQRYNGPGNGDDFALSIAVDDAGNSYVVGDSLGSSTGIDFATIKYDMNGN